VSSKPRSEPKPDEGSGKYPPVFSPAWHALRAGVLAEIASDQRRRRVEFTPEQKRTARLAMELATLEHGMVGYDEALKAWQDDAAVRLTDPASSCRVEMTPEQLLALWRANGRKPMKPPAEMTEAEYVF